MNHWWIGIDPGTHTGIALWDGQSLVRVETLPIHKAMVFVQECAYDARMANTSATVVFEDARKRVWFGERAGREKLQGAGSIKRDCSIWEDFLADEQIEFIAVKPVVGGTKMTAEQFAAITGWTARCSNHARDAAMLVFGR